ncbi:MAG: tetratricopeptide repeat protein [Bacteroidales bacterium]|jgi:tetratricopeptide (TPR) repeat protein
MKRPALLIILCFSFPFIQAQTTVEYFNRAHAKDSINDYSGAVSDCNKAIKLNPDDEKAYGERGKAKLHQSDWTGAISDLSKAIELNPKDENIYSFRGLAKDALKDYTGAKTDLNKAIELNPKDAMAYFNRSFVMDETSDYSNEILDFDKVIRLDSLNKFGMNKYAYYLRGNAKHKLGNNEAACSDWNKAGELGESNAYANIILYCKN